MPVARTLSSLQIYDILGNLIPGTTFLILLATLIEVENYLGQTNSSLLVATFIILGFVIGHVIQSIASSLNGTPRLFGLFVAEIRETEPYDPEGTLENLPDEMRSWLGLKRADLSDLRITDVEEEFWPMAQSHFGLSDDFADHGRLMQLVLSYLETVSATRALRFQSIHTFHRSMWGMWFLSFFAVLLVAIGDSLNLIVARSWLVLVSVALGSLFGIRIFGQRKEKFNQKVVEYAIVDFYTEQVSQ